MDGVTPEALNRALFDNSDDALLVAAADGRLLALNDRGAALTGWSPNDLHELRLDALIASLPALAAGGSITARECEVRRRDGATVPVTLALRPIADGAHLIVLRERARPSQSDDSLREAVRVAHVGIFDHDHRTNLVYWSPELREICGWGLDEPLPFDVAPSGDRTESTLIHPDDRARAAAALTRAHTSEDGRFDIDYRIVRRDGTVRWLTTRSQTFFEGVGAARRPVRSIGAVRDITEGKDAEHALRASEERLRQVARVAKIGIFDHDHRSGEIYWSPEMREIYGWSADEPVLLRPDGGGRSPADVTYEEDRERIAIAVRRAHTVGQMDEEFRVVSTNGVVRWVRTQAQTFFTGMGAARAPIRTIGATVDITERKHEEAERERLHAQLVQAQKMESVGRLAGGVAHDFNNMLNVISGYAELALGQIDMASPLYGPLLEIQNATSRSTELTRQLLAFARRQPVQPRVLDLNTLVERALNMLRRLIGEDIQLTWIPGTPLGSVKIDPAQVDQILVNLVVNARDAIAGHGQITVRTRNEAVDAATSARMPGSVPGSYVMLEVTDDGRGIDEETRTHIFEPFFTTKGDLQGTGLGLATVYGIVKQNDGFIGIESVLGRGSTLRVLLPRISEAAAEIESGRRRGAATGSETILLVEDEEMVLRLSTRMLESLGYTVLPAATPGEATRLAQQHAARIDLLVTDVVMPETSGQTLAQRLRTSYPGLKCLYLSGYLPGSSLEMTLGEGAHFLQKPFSRSDLASKVREALADATHS